MTRQFKRDVCVSHYGEEVEPFFQQLCGEEARRCLIIAGAGFDPRATTISKMLHKLLGDRLTCIFIKEERPHPEGELVKRATDNLAELQAQIKNQQVIHINIFDTDNAVIGGATIAREMARLVDFQQYTDVFVDFSALSIGISFPIVKFLQECTDGGSCKCNVHIVVSSNPNLDEHIVATANDIVSEIKGFPKRDLQGELKAVTLWLPELSTFKRNVLKQIHKEIEPQDSCPVLPFPAADPKKGDRLVESFIEEFETEWRVDPRNFIYAHEDDPIDLYRTILKIDDERKPIFENLKTLGKSVLVLSPAGSKLLSIGFLMAALQRELPIVYVEALKYDVDWHQIDGLSMKGSGKLAHVWLFGEAYK